MTCYELLTDYTIKKQGLKLYKDHQNYYVIRSSVFSGMVAALITNPMEVIVLRK